MGATPEHKVKQHLKKRVEQYGGELVFVKYIGRNFCMDTRMRFPGGEVAVRTFGISGRVQNAWVETKAIAANGSLSTGQEREIERLTSFGETVYVLNSIEAIDNLLPPP
jgi:hypothetical protein